MDGPPDRPAGRWLAAAGRALIGKAPGATGGVRSGAAAQLLGVCISALFPSGRPWPCLARALVSSSLSSLMINQMRSHHAMIESLHCIFVLGYHLVQLAASYLRARSGWGVMRRYGRVDDD